MIEPQKSPSGSIRDERAERLAHEKEDHQRYVSDPLVASVSGDTATAPCLNCGGQMVRQQQQTAALRGRIVVSCWAVCFSCQDARVDSWSVLPGPDTSSLVVK